MRAGIKFEHIQVPTPDQVQNSKKQSIHKAIDSLRSFDPKEHLDDAKQVLASCNGDAEKAVCKLIACLK